jgi:hypothetical protein
VDKIYDVKDNFYKELEHVFDKFPKFHMKFVLDFNAMVGKVDSFKSIIGNAHYHEIINDNAIRVVNFAATKNLTARSYIIQESRL